MSAVGDDNGESSGAGINADPRPFVSVIMPAYNAEAHLAEAVHSILKQTCTNFELLAIDDGSKDRTFEILSSFQDSRIRIIRNECNLGLIESLNKAIKLARGPYIARMDADDISVPERLSWQVEFLEAHPDVSVLGGGIEFIDENGRVTGRPRRVICGAALIRWRFLFGNCVNHPTVMMRRKDLVFEDGPESDRGRVYSERFKHAEDYELWLRISRKHKVENLDRKLLFYRVHSASVSQVHSRAQIDSSVRALKEHLKIKFGHEAGAEVLAEILFPRVAEPNSEVKLTDYFARFSPQRAAGELARDAREARGIYRFLLMKLMLFRALRHRRVSFKLLKMILKECWH